MKTFEETKKGQDLKKGGTTKKANSNAKPPTLREDGSNRDLHNTSFGSQGSMNSQDSADENRNSADEAGPDET